MYICRLGDDQASKEMFAPFQEFVSGYSLEDLCGLARICCNTVEESYQCLYDSSLRPSPFRVFDPMRKFFPGASRVLDYDRMQPILCNPPSPKCPDMFGAPILVAHLPELVLLWEATLACLKLWPEGAESKMKALLKFCAEHYAYYEDGEAIIYQISRNPRWSPPTDSIVARWKHEQHERDDIMRKVRAIASFDWNKESHMPWRCAPSALGDLRHSFAPHHFWRLNYPGMSQSLEATMLRMSQWCNINRVEECRRKLLQHLHSEVLKGASRMYWKPKDWFDLFRADLMMELPRAEIENDLKAKGALAIQRMATSSLPGSAEDDDQGVMDAASIVFGALRIPGANLDDGVVENLAEQLLYSQRASGAWAYFCGTLKAEQESVLRTAMAVHALCLARPEGWQDAVSLARRWLQHQLNEFGYWRENCLNFWVHFEDIIYLTVLVLDAIELAGGGTTVTFRTFENPEKKAPGVTPPQIVTTSDYQAPSPLRRGPKPKITCEEKTYKYLLEQGHRNNVTCREIHNKTGYSRSRIAQTKAWKAYQARRELEAEQNREKLSGNQGMDDNFVSK